MRIILILTYCLLTISTFSQTKEEKAINRLTERIAADSTNAELYVMRGMIWAELKQWKKSIPDLGKALSLVAKVSKTSKPSPYFDNDNTLDSSKIIEMRAICYGELDMLDSAISDFHFLQKRHPKHFYYIVAVAQLYIDKKLFDKAQAEIDRIKKTKELEERVLSCQAILFLEQGNYEKALQAVDKALEKHPGSIQSLLTKSKILVKLDRKPEACKYADEGLQKMNREYFGEVDYVMDFTFQFQDFKKEYCQ